MARKVKCQICKSVGTNETFFKVTDQNGKNKYYCSQEEYESYINEQNKRYDLLKYIAEEVFEYEKGQIVNPILVKKINELNKFYDYEVIHECFRRNKDTIQYWIKNKNFSSEYGMMMYILQIIKRGINDVYKEWKFKKEQEVKIESNSIDIEMLNSIGKLSKPQTTDNGILMFLEEEDI